MKETRRGRADVIKKGKVGSEFAMDTRARRALFRPAEELKVKPNLPILVPPPSLDEPINTGLD